MRQVHGWSDQISLRQGQETLAWVDANYQDPALELPAQVMKLLVTGGCGYKDRADPAAGRWPQRDQHRHPVVWECPSPSTPSSPTSSWMCATACHPTRWVRPSFIWPTSTISGGAQSHPSWEVNVLACQQLADRAVARRKHFLYEPGSVYGV